MPVPKRILKGKVVSSSSNKTIIVEVVRRIRHPKYHKVIMSRNKFAAHDENNVFKVGDIVSIEESRPISKTKTWIVLNNKAEIQ